MGWKSNLPRAEIRYSLRWICSCYCHFQAVHHKSECPRINCKIPWWRKSSRMSRRTTSLARSLRDLQSKTPREQGWLIKCFEVVFLQKRKKITKKILLTKKFSKINKNYKKLLKNPSKGTLLFAYIAAFSALLTDLVKVKMSREENNHCKATMVNSLAHQIGAKWIINHSIQVKNTAIKTHSYCTFVVVFTHTHYTHTQHW